MAASALSAAGTCTMTSPSRMPSWCAVSTVAACQRTLVDPREEDTDDVAGGQVRRCDGEDSTARTVLVL